MRARTRLLVLLVAALVGVASGRAEAGSVGAGDPPWSVDEALLATGLDCPAPFTHPEREPVLLVHGTGTAGSEQFSWNYGLLLPDRGFDVCYVTYPDRGLGDLQVSAEYVAHAILALHERTGGRVDVMGHSQGGLLPRWAVRFWPSVQAVVDDVVLVAPPSHGTSVAAGVGSSPLELPAAFWQMGPSSAFIAALNSGDETPGDDVSWSVLFTDQDELVQPASPVPTAALDWDRPASSTRNVRVGDVCPGRLVDHLSIGTTDRLSQELVLDAFANPGPVDPARLGPPDALCALPDQYASPAQLAALVGQLPRSFGGGPPDLHLVGAEPALQPYASAALAAAAAPAAPVALGVAADDPAGITDAAPSSVSVDATATPTSAARLPSTGSRVPLAAAAFALLAALGLRSVAKLARRSTP